MLFGGREPPDDPSRVMTAKDVNEAPGTSEVTEAYQQAIEEENVRRTEQAVRTNTSAMPMPVEPPKGTIGLQVEDPEEEDPLERWRRMQEQRIREQKIDPQVIEPEEPAPPPPPDTRTPAINALAEAMSTQMESVLSNQGIAPMNIRSVAALSYLENIAAAEEAELAAQMEAAQQNPLNTGETAVDDLNIIVPAGTIEYAQILTEVNTDAPGPVLAEIVTGPMKGARAIGTFQATYNYLVLNFNTFVLDGVNFAAQGVALDPATTLPGMVTDIDRRYLRRIALPAAAEFIEGFSSALAQSGQTTITISGDSVTETTSTDDLDTEEAIFAGVEEAGEQVADVVEEVADQIEPMLMIEAGTPIGILFTQPVIGTPQVILQRDLQEPSQGVNFPVGVNNGVLPRFGN
jgi:intracellular multiplication protein IcmE